MVRLSFRPIVLALLAVAGFCASAVPARADAPVLRPAVTVNDADLRIGDLFAGAGVHAGEIVAAAPAPGTRIVLDASWLAATAQAHGLAWQPASDAVTTEVTRTASIIDQGEISRQLLAVIAPGNSDAQISLDARVKLYVPVGTDTKLAIENLQVDPMSGRFNADLRAAAGDSASEPVHVAGRLVNVIQIPTLTRPMLPGEVIGAADIAWIAVDIGRLPAGQVMDARDLIGRTPRRPIRAQEFLRPIDLEVPVLVHRNDAVLIVLQAPGMTLTAQGKALEDGGRGEMIRVVNIQSNRTIDATVQAAGQVGLFAPGAAPPVL